MTLRKTLARLALTVAAGVLTLPAWGEESGWAQLNMPKGVTDISRKIYALHMEIFWVCVAIGVVGLGAMIWSIMAFRKSKGAVSDTTMVHNTQVEVVWTIVPVIILIAM